MNDCDLPLVLDVSGWQPVGLVPWSDPRIVGGIVKATQGDCMQPSAQQHCRRVREAQKPLGLYHFFHPEVTLRGQFEALDTVAAKVGYGLTTDIVPAMDIEYFSGHGVTRAWNTPLEGLAEMLAEAFAPPLLYLSESTWICLGRPTWVNEYPLWVPWYFENGFEHPKNIPPRYVPSGNDWCLWQYYGGQLFGKIQGSQPAVDHNAAKRLPLIGDEQ